MPFGTWTLEFMRSTCYFAQSLDFEELRIDFGCGLAGLVANYYYRTGCQAVGLISGVSGRSLQNPKRGGVWNRTFSKGSKGGAPGRNVEERGGADTHTFATDANVWGTRQALAQRTGKVGAVGTGHHRNQNNSMGAVWPDAEARRPSRVTRRAPSFSASATYAAS